jgi:hypothetical protein
MLIARLASLALVAVIASGQSARVLTRESETPFILKLGGLAPPRPIWSGRALLATEIPESRELVLEASTSDGRSEEVRFSDHDWGLLRVAGLWGGEDGRIVLAGTGQTEPGVNSSFIGWISADRRERKIVKVEGYGIQVMTVGPGGAIWALAVKYAHPPDRAGLNVLLRFSPDGKLLTSTYVTARGVGPLVDGVPAGSADVSSRSSLRASTDRVAWLTAKNEYIEFDSSGSEITRLDGPMPAEDRDLWDQALSISPANTALISMPHSGKTSKDRFVEVWTLDRVANQWFKSDPAEGSFPWGTRIYGFHDSDLMTSGVSRQLGTLLVRYRLSESR